jgi:hypothetical protein
VEFAKSRDIQIEVTRLAEAREYRETLARRAPKTPEPVEAETFPDQLFAVGGR